MLFKILYAHPLHIAFLNPTFHHLYFYFLYTTIFVSVYYTPHFSYVTYFPIATFIKNFVLAAAPDKSSPDIYFTHSFYFIVLYPYINRIPYYRGTSTLLHPIFSFAGLLLCFVHLFLWTPPTSFLINFISIFFLNYLSSLQLQTKKFLIPTYIPPIICLILPPPSYRVICFFINTTLPIIL